MAYLRMDDRGSAEMRVEAGRRDPLIHARFSIQALDGVALFEGLQALTDQEGSELRTDFPSGWTVFWKLRQGESRFFVAHPESDQWVATLALSRTHLDQAVEAFGYLRAEAGKQPEEQVQGAWEFKLTQQLPGVSRMSNVEVVFSLEKGLPSSGEHA
jgi:hypothetical protein